MAVLVGVKGPLMVALQFLLQNNGMIVQTCQWSSKHLQKQVNQLLDLGEIFFRSVLMHNLLFVPAGGSAALFHDGHLDKSCETYTNWTFFLSFFLSGHGLGCGGIVRHKPQGPPTHLVKTRGGSHQPWLGPDGRYISSK